MKYHKQQHKSESEEKKKNKLLSELKKQVQQLKRKNERLQKKVNQTVAIQEESVEESISLADVEVKPSTAGCPSCGQFDVSKLVTPSLTTLLICKNCKHRWNPEK